jgi:hypothetical protein
VEQVFARRFRHGHSDEEDSASLSSSALNDALTAPTVTATSKDNLEVVLYRDAKLDDGRYANNGWLQELPDPITKIVWDNVVLVSRKTARELDVENGDVVEVSAGGQTIKGAIWTQPGMADYSLGIALGYGREKVGSCWCRHWFQCVSALQHQDGLHHHGRHAEESRWRQVSDFLHAIALEHGRSRDCARGEPGAVQVASGFRGQDERAGAAASGESCGRMASADLREPAR